MSTPDPKIPVAPEAVDALPATPSSQRGPLRPPLRSPSAPAKVEDRHPTGKHRPQDGRTQKRPNPTDPGVLAAIRAAAAHRRTHRPDRAEAERMSKAYRATLIPRKKPGTKPQPETVQAAELYRTGVAEAGAGNQPVTQQFLCKPWEGIKREVIPGFDMLNKYERKCRGDELRRNVKAYLKRRGVKLRWPIRTQRKRRTAIT